MWSIHILHHIILKTQYGVVSPYYWKHYDMHHNIVSLCVLFFVALSHNSVRSCLTGNEQLILTTVIRHLDHKNVSHNPQTKSDIIQTATSLALQLRSRGFAVELVVAGDLCKHLRKTLEAVESGNVEDQNLNESLQNFLEDCLMEVVRGVCAD
jgi:hypothetical protein